MGSSNFLRRKVSALVIRSDGFKVGQQVFFDMPVDFPPCAHCGYQTSVNTVVKNQSLFGFIASEYQEIDVTCLKCHAPWTSKGYIIQLTERPAIDDRGTEYWRVFVEPRHIHEIIEGETRIPVKLLGEGRKLLKDGR